MQKFFATALRAQHRRFTSYVHIGSNHGARQTPPCGRVDDTDREQSSLDLRRCRWFASNIACPFKKANARPRTRSHRSAGQLAARDVWSLHHALQPSGHKLSGSGRLHHVLLRHRGINEARSHGANDRRQPE